MSILLLAVGAAAGCGEKDLLTGGPIYYTGWGGYSLPMRPQGRVSQQQAEELRSYYEAYYDDEGRLVKFIKHLDGQVVWTDSYEYHGKTLARRKMVKANGEVIEQRFEKEPPS